MNKYQEALGILDANQTEFKDNRDITKRAEARLKLQELVDKETPTKTSKSHCGKCNIGYLVQSRGDKYCHVCGYKIDWSDTD